MEQSKTLINVALKNDTSARGGRHHDAITSDPTVAGTLASVERGHRLKARFHGDRQFRDITSLINAGGEFLLDRRELERVLDAQLSDGPYGLRIEAEDSYGATLDSVDVAFTLVTTPPVPILFEPASGGVTSLQLGFVDVALVDATEIEASTIGPGNLLIRNADRTLRISHVEQTADGLFRYYYEGELVDGPVTVVFVRGQVSDVAGNVNSEQHQSFTFVSLLPEAQRPHLKDFQFGSPEAIFNGISQRPARLPIEARINSAYNDDSGGSVYLHSGEAFLRRFDLEISSRGFDFRFERTYRSGWLNYRTPLGHNWDFNYNRRLFVVTLANKFYVQLRFPNAKPSDVVRIDGAGREDLYTSTEGKEPYVSPPGFYTRLTEDGGVFVERDQHGNVITYQPVIGGADVRPMTKLADRNGNTMRFEYDEGRLKLIVDTLGRKVECFYEDRLLVMLRDFIGREIRFGYDSEGHLEAVTGPRVIGTPHGNDFPNGKTERYTYGASNQPRPFRRHNLLTVTAANEVARNGGPRETYVYNDDGRVIEQAYGGANHSGVSAGGVFRVPLPVSDTAVSIRAVRRPCDTSCGDHGQSGRSCAGQGPHHSR